MSTFCSFQKDSCSVLFRYNMFLVKPAVMDYNPILFFLILRWRHALDVKFWRSKCTTVLVITWLVPFAGSNSAGSVWKKSQTCITWVHQAALFGAKNLGRERKNCYGSWELWSELRWELLYWLASQFQLCSSEFLHGLEGKFTIISKVGWMNKIKKLYSLEGSVILPDD